MAMSKTKKTYQKPTLDKRSKLSAISANVAVSPLVKKVSDRRLKRNIIALRQATNGLKLYSFQYQWSDTVYVGVMAQDLLDQPQFSHAVSKLPEGYYQVDYDSLGIRMSTYEEWTVSGLLAVQPNDASNSVSAV
jgi:hypothetical protein